VLGGALYCHIKYLVGIVGLSIMTLTILLVYVGDPTAKHNVSLL
jgi:hypothetical protein